LIAPDSVVFAYEQALSTINPLAEVAGKRLRVICKQNNWLFDDRIKSLESCLSKLENGSAPLVELHDLYATTVVVPTQNEVGPACSLLLEEFNGAVKERREISAESFVYDDVHVIAKLGNKISPRAVSSPAILERPFEIQVRTGVQFAWWRATHEAMYKSGELESHTWKMRRAAGQARAALELLDGLLSDLPKAASLQRDLGILEQEEMRAKDWLRLWPVAGRPSDIYRYCQTVNNLLKTCGLSHENVENTISDPSFSEVIALGTITPVQAILVAMHRLLGTEFPTSLRKAGVKVLITEEFVVSFPEIADGLSDVMTAP
jgi:ppGpp synthetase/RelA/SpoT-type nucleotidyltranferase